MRRLLLALSLSLALIAQAAAQPVATDESNAQENLLRQILLVQKGIIVKDMGYRDLIKRLKIEIPERPHYTKPGPGQDDRFIYGSVIVTAPALLALYFKKGQDLTMACTATLINRQVALTAGHCLCSHKSPLRLDFADSFKSDLPQWTRYKIDAQVHMPRLDAGGDVAGSDCSRQNSEWRKSGDIALVRLDSWPNIEPAQVRTMPASTPPGEELTVMGFGATEETAFKEKRFPKDARGATMTLRSADCQGKEVQDKYGCEPNIEMVALGGKERAPRTIDPATCNGDSGGPATLASSKTLQVVGVIASALRGKVGDNVDALTESLFNRTRLSLGENYALRCGHGTIFTRISEPIRRWIDACGRCLEAHPASASGPACQTPPAAFMTGVRPACR